LPTLSQTGESAAKEYLIIRMISLIVPCFNEADGLDAFFGSLRTVVEGIKDFEFEVICIDDGSRDDTLNCLLSHAQRWPCITVVELSRNFGKECALSAGLDLADGAAVIPLDADLQHPPELIPEMIRLWQEGADVVLARRRSREGDGWPQRWLTERFYRFHNALSECEIPPDVGDFRLMDRRVADSLKAMPERKRFMKGMFAWVGYRQVTVDFDVRPRHAGRSRFSAKRLFGLALDGIASFSTVPLSMWVYFGSLFAFFSFIYGAWIVIKTLWLGADVPGYASILTAVLFLGGVQLIGIGVLGEYIGRIYNETKQRPVYLVRSIFRHARHDEK
jgi:glycosyltransferase involved in cell wall biosynthesis